MTVAAYTCTLDPVSGIAGRTELSLNSGAINITAPNNINWGEAAIKAFMAEQLYGEAPTDYRVPNRQIEIPLTLGAKGTGTEAEEEEAREQLQQKVALFQKEGGVLLRQRANGEPLYADIVNASLTIPDVYGEGGAVEPGVVLKLECLPDFYGESVELEAVTGAGNIVGVLKQAKKAAMIAGDYPARARIQLSGASVNQKSLLWGFYSRNYSAAETAKLVYDAEQLTPINGAFVKTVSETYSGKVVALSELPENVWFPTLETAISGATPKQLTHVGSYRVWARIRTADSVKVRLAWGNDDGTAPIYNAPATFAGSTSLFGLYDLGEIRIEEPPVGEHWWRGIIQVNSPWTVGHKYELYIDRIWFQPLDDGAGKLRATANPTSQLVRLVKEGTRAENLTGVGTAWENPTGILLGGTHASFNEPGGVSKRLFLSHLGFSLTSGAFIKGIKVYLTMEGPVYAQAYQGGVAVGTAKFVNAPSGPFSQVYGSPTDLWGTTWTYAQINETGFGIGFEAVNLAKLYSTIGIEIYYDFSAAGVAEDAILYEGAEAEARWDGAFREDLGSSAFARVSEETGELVRLPVSGLEKRETELMLKPSRGLLNETDAGIDNFTAKVIYRPCFIGRI